MGRATGSSLADLSSVRSTPYNEIMVDLSSVIRMDPYYQVLVDLSNVAWIHF